MLKISYPGLNGEYSLHNHSDFSDGADTLEHMILCAKKSGIKKFGISDHWCEVPYSGTDYVEWCMSHERLDEYVETLLKLKAGYEDEDFSLLLGLEVEYFDENVEQTIAHLKQYPFDYLIGSVHYAGVFPIDHDIADWLPLDGDRIHEICETYWQKITGAAKMDCFSFIGHLDLPKKFAMINEDRYFDNAVKVLDELAKSGGAIELNTAGWLKKCAAAYPNEKILREAFARKIPVVISSDAHCCKTLTSGFDRAAAMLNDVGYKL